MTSSPISRIKHLWQVWITPRAAHPESAFRERTLRGIYPVLLFTWLLVYPILGSAGMLNHQPIEVVVTGSIIAGMGIALWRNAIIAAALVFISFFVLILYTNFNYAYWFDGNLPLMMLLVFVISIVLPKSYLFPGTFALLVYYGFFAITQDAAGRGPEALEWYVMENATMSIIVSAVLLNIESLLLGYLRTEFDRRFHDLQALNASLEQRVSERTRDLEIARQRAEEITEINNRVTKATSEADILAAFDAIMARYGTTSAVLLYVEHDDSDQPVALRTHAARMAGGQPMPLEMLPITYYPLEQFPFTSKIFGGDLLFIEDAFHDARLGEVEQQAMRALNLSASIFIPLVVGEQWQAVIILSWVQPKVFVPELRDLIHQLQPRLADNVAARRAFMAEHIAREQLERLYAEQVETAEKLRAVDHMKSQFLASMSHELRTPLNAILNFTRFVSDGILGPVNEKQVDALSKTISSGKHLLALINDVLDITKIESGMLNLFVEREISLRDELNTVVATAQSLLTDKPVNLLVDFDPNLPLLVCDRRRVRQILLNLVSNACKFTESGSVTIAAHRMGDHVLMSVRDTGPGIAASEHNAIFEAFRQTKTGLRQGSGTGLGLAIARRLAEAHGGKLWLESTLGQGTTFYVELPVESPMLVEIMVQSLEPAAS